MRSLVYILFLIALLMLGYLLQREQPQENQWQDSPLESSSGASLNQIASQAAATRDEYGAVILSNPADDLAGIEVTGQPGRSMARPVGERALYLLELYGARTGEQLAFERSVLRKRFDDERALGLELEHDPGLRELRDTLEWLDRRLGGP